VLLRDLFLSHKVPPSTHPPEAGKQSNTKEIAIAGCFSCRKKEIVKIQALATLKYWTQKINVAEAGESSYIRDPLDKSNGKLLCVALYFHCDTL
jgi:hypothetical protein